MLVKIRWKTFRNIIKTVSKLIHSRTSCFSLFLQIVYSLMNFHVLHKIIRYFVVGSVYHRFAQTICWFMSILIIDLNSKIIFKFNNFRSTICAPVDKILWCVCVSWQIHTDPMRHYLCSPKCVKWMFYVNFYYQKNTKHQQHDKKKPTTPSWNFWRYGVSVNSNSIQFSSKFVVILRVCKYHKHNIPFNLTNSMNI